MHRAHGREQQALNGDDLKRTEVSTKKTREIAFLKITGEHASTAMTRTLARMSTVSTNEFVRSRKLCRGSMEACGAFLHRTFEHSIE